MPVIQPTIEVKEEGGGIESGEARIQSVLSMYDKSSSSYSFYDITVDKVVSGNGRVYMYDSGQMGTRVTYQRSDESYFAIGAMGVNYSTSTTSNTDYGTISLTAGNTYSVNMRGTTISLLNGGTWTGTFGLIAKGTYLSSQKSHPYAAMIKGTYINSNNTQTFTPSESISIDDSVATANPFFFCLYAEKEV